MCFYIGEFDKVLETFEFLSCMNDEDGSDVMRKYEDRLIDACNRADILMKNLVDFIIAGEKLDLENLLSSAITLASKCSSSSLRIQKRYKEISEDTKNKINEKRVTFLEQKGGLHCDEYLR